MAIQAAPLSHNLNLPFSNRFQTVFEPFSTVFGPFSIVLEPFSNLFASFSHRFFPFFRVVAPRRSCSIVTVPLRRRRRAAGAAAGDFPELIFQTPRYLSEAMRQGPTVPPGAQALHTLRQNGVESFPGSHAQKLRHISAPGICGWRNLWLALWRRHAATTASRWHRCGATT